MDGNITQETSTVAQVDWVKIYTVYDSKRNV